MAWARSIAGAGEVTDDAELGGLIVAEALNALRGLRKTKTSNG